MSVQKLRVNVLSYRWNIRWSCRDVRNCRCRCRDVGELSVATDLAVPDSANVPGAKRHRLDRSGYPWSWNGSVWLLFAAWPGFRPVQSCQLPKQPARTFPPRATPWPESALKTSWKCVEPPKNHSTRAVLKRSS